MTCDAEEPAYCIESSHLHTQSDTHTHTHTHIFTVSLLLSSSDVCVSDPVFVRLIEGRSSDCLRHNLSA